MELRDRWVNFRIQDVYLPDPENLLRELHGAEILQGRVVEVSSSGEPEGVFVVVKVDGLERPIIVPLNRVLGVL